MMMNNGTIQYPDRAQVEAVRLVEAAVEVAGLPDLFCSEALLCAADALEKSRGGDNSDPGNYILGLIAKHYREAAAQ